MNGTCVTHPREGIIISLICFVVFMTEYSNKALLSQVLLLYKENFRKRAPQRIQHVSADNPRGRDDVSPLRPGNWLGRVFTLRPGCQKLTEYTTCQHPRAPFDVSHLDGGVGGLLMTSHASCWPQYISHRHDTAAPTERGAGFSPRAVFRKDNSNHI